jgi:hypothetical protein
MVWFDEGHQRWWRIHEEIPVMATKSPPKGNRERKPGIVATLEESAAVAFLRIFIGVFWLFELTVGHNWKIGGFGSDVHPGWIGAERGGVVREDVAEAVADGTWAWFGALYEGVLVPNAVLFSWLTIILQAALAIGFILGAFVRPLALMALVMDFSIFMLGNSRIPPFFTAAHLALLATGAGNYYGLDGWLTTRLHDAKGAMSRTVVWLINLPVLNRARGALLAAAAGMASLYFLMSIISRPTARIQMVALDLALLFGLIVLGLVLANRIPDRFAIVAAVLRIFVGLKFLHEIWVRTDPGVNALPGWANVDAQREFWLDIVAANHWAPFAWIAENIIAANMTAFAILFGTVQFVIGIALIVGYRTRLAGLLGLVYLGGLMSMGLTRYAPFVFGLLVVVVALSGGRVLSLDAVLRTPSEKALGLPVPKAAINPLIVLAAINAIAATWVAFRTGIEPGAYVESMTAMVPAFVAIFSGLFAFVGWIQTRPELATNEMIDITDKEPLPDPEPIT